MFFIRLIRFPVLFHQQKEGWKSVVKGVVYAFVIGMGAAMFIPAGASAFEIAAGAQGGLSLASLIGRNAVPGNGWENKSLIGFNGGAVAVIDFTRFGLEVECLYTRKGIRAIQSSASGEFTRKYTYLDLPVLAKFIITIEHGAPLRQTFFAGPCFSFLKEAIETDTCCSGTADKKDEMKPLDIGVILGFAAEIDVGPGRIVFDVRYNHGFSSLDRIEDIRTSLVGVSLGYVFSIFTTY
jgi:hypothetical protein